MKLVAKKGFTLIEVIIYVAILAIVLGFALLSVFKLGDSTAMNRSRVAVASESDFMMQKIGWALAGATAVTEPAVGATSSRLSVQKYGFANNPVVIALASGTVSLQRGAGAAVPLTTSNVKVDSLVFTHGPEVLSAPEFIQILMGVSPSSSDPRASQASTTIQTTIYLHK